MGTLYYDKNPKANKILVRVIQFYILQVKTQSCVSGLRYCDTLKDLLRNCEKSETENSGCNNLKNGNLKRTMDIFSILRDFVLSKCLKCVEDPNVNISWYKLVNWFFWMRNIMNLVLDGYTIALSNQLTRHCNCMVVLSRYERVLTT